MVGEASWDSRFVIGLLMARVERLLNRRVVCRIDDFFDFRDDPFNHQLQAMSQGHLRGRTALAAANGDDVTDFGKFLGADGRLG